MNVECERVGGVNLSQGVCDLAVPAPVVDAAKAAIDKEDDVIADACRRLETLKNSEARDAG